MVALLLAGTLAPLGPAGTGARVAWRCMACTADGGADFVANVAAFAPLGLALVAAGARVPRATLLGAALSLGIELVQALGVPGRTATLGDVLANAAGTLLGAALAARAGRLLRPSPVGAARLAAAAAVLWTWTMTASAWLLGRDALPGPRPPRVGILATVPNLGWYHGRVARFTLDGWTAGRADAGPLIVAAPLGRRVRADAELRGGDGRQGFVPAVAVVAADRRPAFLLGHRDGTAAEARVRRRAHRWRLREPALVLPGAFAASAEGDATARATVTAALDGSHVTLRVTREAGTERVDRAAGLHAGPALGWSLVVPAVRPWGPERALLDALWVATLLVPAGYWAGAGARRSQRAPAAGVAAGLAVVVTGLAIGPTLAGAAPGTPADAVAAAGALALGWQLARRTAARRSAHDAPPLVARLPGPPAPVSFRA